jgi:hypothetical protein
MPQDAIEQVGQMGHQQKMPKTLTFANHFGFELPDVNDDVDDDHNSDYELYGDKSANDSDDDSAAPSSDLSEDDDNDDDSFNDDDDNSNDDDNDGDDITQPLLGLSAGVAGCHRE